MSLTERIWFEEGSLINRIVQCFLLSVLYVGGIHFFDNGFYNRDHPTAIKQRFKSVILVSIIAPLIVFLFSNYSSSGHSLNLWLGCHSNNIGKALILPLLLTMILFSGPLFMRLCENNVEEFRREVLSGAIFTDVKWYRDYFVAPLTEEFVFRSCMLPLIYPAFGTTKSIFITPLFFGVAHIHHAIEHLRNGQPVKNVLIICSFQMFYTTLFGAYCCFIFLRTGHFLSVVVCHSFCNFMGFPDFEAIPESRFPILTTVLLFGGLILFLFLLFPMTAPHIYASIYY